MNGWRVWWRRGARRSFARRRPTLTLGVVALCLAVAGCGSVSGTVSHPTATATAAPKVRYTADWSHGLDGWQATPGWTVTNGALESSTDTLSLTVPYQPPAGNYVVEIDLQVISEVGNSGYYTLNVAPTSNADGYRAGVFGLRSPGPRPNGDHPTITTTIDPLDDTDSTSPVGTVTDFEPGDGVRTYRIVIDGPSVSLYVDGRYFVGSSSGVKPHLATGPLVLKVGAAHLRITGLRVVA